MRVGQTQSAGVEILAFYLCGKECPEMPQRSEQQARGLRECDWHNRGSTAGEENVVCEDGVERTEERNGSK
jgi:hypothetical protein